MSFIEQIKEISNDLTKLGLTSYYPKEQERELSRHEIGEEAFSVQKGDYIRAHLLKIESTDKVLVANYTKNGVGGYIGPNSLIELAFGYALGKELYLLNEPGEQSCKPEILGMKPKILYGEIKNL